MRFASRDPVIGLVCDRVGSARIGAGDQKQRCYGGIDGAERSRGRYEG